MKIGIPKERKEQEYRVALTPSTIALLKGDDFEFLVESEAGFGSGYHDEQYLDAGAHILSRDDLYLQADLICKVKEPIPEEWRYYQPHHVLFSYLHLAAYPGLTEFLLREKLTALAFETYTIGTRELPLLQPMSKIAGRVGMLAAVQQLQKPSGGIGQLISGLGRVDAAKVVVVGAGNVGKEAARVALGLGADVILFDQYEPALEQASLDLAGFPEGTLQVEIFNQTSFQESISNANIIVGAVLLPGGKAPCLISNEEYKYLSEGTILVDVSIDQGGCFAHSKATTHLDPIYIHQGIRHYGVANIPGAVPKTASEAISQALIQPLKELKQTSLDVLIKEHASWRSALNTQGGLLKLEALKEK